jgi:3',5'-cyclic AMP phosphodiesterase CpdA
MSEQPETPTLRFAHLSDIHITARPLGWAARDWLTKRFAGWVNYQFLGRKRRFRQADDVLRQLMAEVRSRQPDRVIFSGDATALGFEAEFIRAADLLGVSQPEPLPGIAVPGNHDYYTHGAVRAGLFEHYFAPWQAGERLDGATYPFAQRVGPVWLIGVNSCTANRWPLDAGGSVDEPQLQRLEWLLASLAPGLRILVTHYPVCVAGGQRERRTHGLRNLDDLVRVAAAGGVCLWLHGHRHGPYHLPDPSLAPFPVICSGSATQTDRWSYGDYLLEGRQFRATRRVFSPREQRFMDRESFTLTLAGG